MAPAWLWVTASENSGPAFDQNVFVDCSSKHLGPTVLWLTDTHYQHHIHCILYSIDHPGCYHLTPTQCNDDDGHVDYNSFYQCTQSMSQSRPHQIHHHDQKVLTSVEEMCRWNGAYYKSCLMSAYCSVVQCNRFQEGQSVCTFGCIRSVQKRKAISLQWSVWRV